MSIKKETEAEEMSATEKEKREFGERFTQAVNQSLLKGFTNVELGRRFGVSGPMISYWQRGEKIPSVPNGIIIAKLTKVAFEWLMTGRGKMKEGRRSTPEAEALLYIFEGSNQEGQAQMLLNAAHQAWLAGDHERAKDLQEMAEMVKQQQ